VRTYSPKPGDVTREWHVIDATDVVLGRLAVQTATLLRGKHKTMYAPHVDTGDFVIIVNADKVVLSAGKAEKKLVYRHSGYPGGIRSRTYRQLLDTRPEEAVRRTVKGMLPKTRLGRAQMSKLKVYGGPTHPHGAQKPETLEIPHAKAPVAGSH